MTEDFKWQSGRLRVDEATCGELRRMLIDESKRLTAEYKDKALDDKERQLAYFARKRVRRLQRELGRTMTEKGWWYANEAETESMGAEELDADEAGFDDPGNHRPTTAHPHLSGNVLESAP